MSFPQNKILFKGRNRNNKNNQFKMTNFNLLKILNKTKIIKSLYP